MARWGWLAGIAFIAGVAHAQDAPDAPTVRLGDGDQPLDVEVVAQRLDVARQQILPSLGATRYDFSPEALATIPQGANAPLNQVLLQAPGVAQDSFGQVHLRGEHANIQYRINGVQLPEGLSVFGQAIQSRFAHSLSLLTGALPAQYGFFTAGVVDIQTKTGITDPGLAITAYGGSWNWAQPSFEYGGRSGPVDWFVTGDYLHNDRGIENPTYKFSALHDTTDQFHGLAYVSGIIDENTRISLILGGFTGWFQIPNNPGQTPQLGLTVNGISTFNSSSLNENQHESTDFAILSLQKHIGDFDVQVSAFGRYSNLAFSPDLLGDVLFNGIAQNANREDSAGGVQTDASWRVNDQHTIRAGFTATAERETFRTVSQVLPVDASGMQTSDVPLTVFDSGGKTGGLYGVYLQDEWHVLPKLTVNFGARFDAVDQYVYENQLSPRINVVWKPTDTTTLYAGYARYFVPPPFELVANTTIAKFIGTTGAPTVLQNDPTKAERSNYYDAGINQTVLPGLALGFDAYYKQANHLIDEGQFGAPIIFTAFNYNQGEIAGGQLTASYDRGPWSIYGNLAYSRAIGKDIVSAQFNFQPDELAYIAQHWIYLDHNQTWSSSAGIAYTLNRETNHPTLFSADLLVQSGLRASTATVPNGVSLPNYAVVNLSIVQKLDLGIGAGTQLRLDALNVGDAIYQIRNGTGVGVGAPQYGIRRTILAGLTQRF